ncbi:hypothetical protein DOTSEDRAFT_52428 [Dothistroma septosporum NZE10]|uniref:Uncharacterized protein n=1 Tax=Dothistroma septosporum (strain NZE10 / CBS 128990) TaxID=675120 RepID=N1PNQ6_DOTSN|nr:hypothetical protein DOTSEDRAFT_52428 [Dothistroma septosporum NZE10]
MRPKFIMPKLDLKISSLRPDARAWRDQYAQCAAPPESRPSTPKSVRPPMAHDVEAELRAACTYVVNHPKPSHEVWGQDAARPALDYAAIKAAEPAPAPNTLPARKSSLRAKIEARLEAVMQETTLPSSKYSYRPNVQTDELFRNEDTTAMPAVARSRADLLMAPEPPRHASSSTGTHTVAHSHSSSQQQVSIPIQFEPAVKVRPTARSDSARTSGSTPHTESTDYPWSTSTGITSAVNTPARSSKRASSQNVTSESGSAPKVETANAEWMKQELEKHKRAIELREKERERLLEEQHNLVRLDKDNARMRTISQVPERKPVPSRPESRQARDVSRPGTRQDTRSDESRLVPKGRGRADSGRAEQSQQIVDQEPRGRVPQRSNSRLRNASRTARRAVSRAGSITNDILGHYLRPDPEAASQGPTSPTPRHRSVSRTRHIANNVKDYFRPGTATGSRKPSIDAVRGHVRNQSSDSFHSAAPERHGSDVTHKPWMWRSQNKNVSHLTPDLSRPESAASERQSADSKPAIDLNRELPPLPSLDSWKDEPKVPPSMQSRPAASMPAAMAPDGLQRALSKTSLWSESANRPMNQEHAVRARLGSPTPPQPEKQSGFVRRPNLRLGPDESVRAPPLISSGTGPSLDEPDLHYLSMTNLSTSRSAEQSAKSSLKDHGHSRLRSQSGLSSRPDVSRPQLPRNTSQRLGYNQDSERPAVVLTGNPNLVYHSRAVAAGLVEDPTREPSPSMGGRVGHSRQNSDRIGADRKTSVDEYARVMDPHFHNAVEIQAKHAVDRERSRRHWWKKQDHKQASWMDQVVRSGAKNGMLVADDTAGSPVVRY